MGLSCILYAQGYGAMAEHPPRLCFAGKSGEACLISLKDFKGEGEREEFAPENCLLSESSPELRKLQPLQPLT